MSKFLNFLADNKDSIYGYLWALVFLTIVFLILSGERIPNGYDYQ